MTIDQTDTLLQKLALKNYLLSMDSLVYAERNEFLIRATKAERSLDLRTEQLESKDRELQSASQIVVLIKEAHKKEVRKIRWAAWRDRIILGLVVALETIYIMKQ